MEFIIGFVAGAAVMFVVKNKLMAFVEKKLNG